MLLLAFLLIHQRVMNLMLAMQMPMEKTPACVPLIPGTDTML